MANSLRSYPSVDHHSSLDRGSYSAPSGWGVTEATREGLSSGRASLERPAMARWEMRISMAQVIVLWLVLAGMMVMVFTFGYHAGREKGLRVALDENGQQTVRLPIATAVKPKNSDVDNGNVLTSGELSSTGVEPGSDASDDAALMASGDAGTTPPLADAQLALSGKLETPEEVSKPLKQEEEGRIDFSKSQGLSEVASAAELSQKRKLAELEDSMSAEEKMRAAKRKEEERRAAQEAKLAAKKAKAERIAALKEKLRAAKLEKIKQEKQKKALAAERAAKAAIVKNEPRAASGNPALKPGWFAQAAATRSENDALSIVRRFKIAGFNSSLERATVRGKQYYRVLVGPYGSRDAASAAREGIKSTGITNGEPFVKRVQ